MKADARTQKNLFRGPTVAIYDAPKIVAARLSQVLSKAGFDVLFEGPLNKETARNDAHIWIAKWTFLFNRAFLGDHHPSKGIVTLSVGTEHIDCESASSLGLLVENCPSFSSNSVAEHAMALAMRAVHRGSVLPALHSSPVIFTRFSDDRAEQAVAQMLIRARQMDESVARARKYEYYRKDAPQYRHDEPWTNTELSGTKVGIVGSDREAVRLARMLRLGFNCELFAYGTSEELDVYHPKRMIPTDMLETCDYIFLCTESIGLQKPSQLDSQLSKTAAELRPERIDSVRELAPARLSLAGSEVAVLGTGNIGSIISRIARLGFGCEVKAFSRTPRDDLTSLGIVYTGNVADAIRDARFIFIALPLNDDTRSLIDWQQMADLPSGLERIIINVTRDQIIESLPLYLFLADGGVTAYGTDVLPNDAILWRGGDPDELTRKFVRHPNVVATPHEGDCSEPSLERMCSEALEKAMKIMGY